MSELLEGPDGKIGCVYPYCNVRVGRELYEMHLLHCRKLYKGKYDFCRYSPIHLLPYPEIAAHEKVCVKRESFERLQRSLMSGGVLLMSGAVPPSTRKTLGERINGQASKPSDGDSAIEELSIAESKLSEDYVLAPVSPTKYQNSTEGIERETEGRYLDAEEQHLQNKGYVNEAGPEKLDFSPTTGKPIYDQAKQATNENIMEPNKATIPTQTKGRGRGRRIKLHKDILRPGGTY